MKSALITLGVIAAIVLFVGMWWMGTYNALVTQNQAVSTSWSNVQTQYQRRFDLVPNLVAATKGALQQEQSVFGAIADARTHYAGAAPGSNDQVQATSQYDSAISRLLVIMENYPQLASLQNVRDLTTELAGTENRIQVARDRYNDQVMSYNVLVQRFPSSIVAGISGFQTRDLFQADQGAATAPVVNLDLTSTTTAH